MLFVFVIYALTVCPFCFLPMHFMRDANAFLKLNKFEPSGFSRLETLAVAVRVDFMPFLLVSNL
jgi:hypothetical protein